MATIYELATMSNNAYEVAMTKLMRRTELNNVYVGKGYALADGSLVLFGNERRGRRETAIVTRISAQGAMRTTALEPLYASR